MKKKMTDLLMRADHAKCCEMFKSHCGIKCHSRAEGDCPFSNESNFKALLRELMDGCKGGE